MTQEQKTELLKLLKKFYKDNSLKEDREFVEVLREFSMNISFVGKLGNYINESKGSEYMHTELLKILSRTVNSLIKLINTNPDMKEFILTKQKEADEIVNRGIKNDKLKIHPPINVNIGISGIDESFDYGKWSPATDAMLSIDTSDIDIITVG